jgi:predicted flap endonuclease-1-like 5' DNA nuclease
MAYEREEPTSNTWIIVAGVFAVALMLLLFLGYGFLASILLALILAAAIAAFLLYMFSPAGGRDRVASGGRPTVQSPTWAEAERAEAPGTGSATPFVSTTPAAEPVRSDPTPGDTGAVGSDAPVAVGTEPLRLDAPREGGADDLKRIKGVGPKLEGALHAMGIYHLDQIASWSPEEVAWMDENLVEFKGRVSRDDWVGQARLLASGGETEFSRRVDKGDVYD